MVPTPYHSFLLRLWRDLGSTHAAWSGELETIQSGLLAPVRSPQEAFDLIRRALDEDAIASDPGDARAPSDDSGMGRKPL